MKKADSWYYDNREFLYLKGHGDKHCCCGGHSHKDVKKNLNHHATRVKFNHQKEREFKFSLRAA